MLNAGAIVKLRSLADRAIGRPPTVVIHRNAGTSESNADRDSFPLVTEWQVPDVRVEQAPNPYPPATLFAGHGRDAQHAPTRIQRWEGGLAIPEVMSVMGWPFKFGKAMPSSLVIGMPRGFQTPQRERPIINQPGSVSVGSLAELAGRAGFSPDLIKITR